MPPSCSRCGEELRREQGDTNAVCLNFDSRSHSLSGERVWAAKRERERTKEQTSTNNHILSSSSPPCLPSPQNHNHYLDEAGTAESHGYRDRERERWKSKSEKAIQSSWSSSSRLDPKHNTEQWEKEEKEADNKAGERTKRSSQTRMNEWTISSSASCPIQWQPDKFITQTW